MENNQDSFRTLEEVQQDIAVFERYGKDIPEELLDEYRKLQKKSFDNQLTSSIEQKLSKLFQEIDFEVSLKINYSPETGLIISDAPAPSMDNQIEELEVSVKPRKKRKPRGKKISIE